MASWRASGKRFIFIMFIRIARHIWYQGMPGFKFYKQNYEEKLSKLKELDHIEDPLHLTQFDSNYDSLHGNTHPIYDLVKRIKYKQNLEISPGSVSFLCYHSAKQSITDPLI